VRYERATKPHPYAGTRPEADSLPEQICRVIGRALSNPTWHT